MAVSLHDTGEEFIQDLVTTSGKTYYVGLFDDSTEALTDSGDLPLASEPDNADDYARQSESASNVSVDVSGADAALDFPTQTFEVAANTESVDSYFTVVNFDSDEAGDAGTASDHLLFTGSLSQTRDLSQIETLEVDNVGGTLS